MPDSTHADPRSSSESSRHKLPKLASDEPLQHELVEYERAAQSVFASEGLTPIFNGQLPIDAQCLQDVDIPDAASDVCSDARLREIALRLQSPNIILIATILLLTTHTHLLPDECARRESTRA